MCSLTDRLNPTTNSNSYWSGKNVFVTGSTGLIGSWITRELVKSGAHVVSLIRDVHRLSILDLVCGKEFKPKTLIYGDLRDYELLLRVLNEYEIAVCLHLAAQAIVGVANKSPLSTFESNVRGTWTLLEACRNTSSIESIVVASSDKAYGEPLNVPITEDHPLIATFPYDASKACVDMIARSYHTSFGLAVAVSRCCNIYGGADLNFSRIIPDTIRSVLLDREPLIRSDGSPIRDFMYIDDAVSGYLLLAENMQRAGVAGNAFNFGTGKPVKVLDLVNKIIKNAGKQNLQPKIMGNKSNEINVQYLDSTKAKQILNWEAKTTLDDGLTKTIQWYKENSSTWCF